MKIIKKSMAIILALAMIITALPTGLTIAKAEGGTILYIKDTIGGDTKTIQDDITNAVRGWAWDAETATLTLSGFNGEYIEADGNINIVLNGTNTITIPSTGGDGIKSSGKITIDDTTSVATDILNISVTNPTDYTTMIASGSHGNEKCTEINGGTLNLTGTTSSGYYSINGISKWVYVNNDAALNIDLSDGGSNINMYGCGSATYLNSSSPTTISVNSTHTSSYCIYSCYYNGAGALNLSAYGKTIITENAFQVYSNAMGPVTVKGNINGASFDKKIWKVEGCDNYIWSHYTTAQSGYNEYLLCDSTGVAIKDPVIERVGEQEFKFMDSSLFDKASIKVGESYEEKPYWYLGCVGGTGSYKFELAEDSAPLPDGLSIDSAGYIKGTATALHPGGTAKIKVTSGEESTTFEINYGAITHKNPVTGLTLDKEEIFLNKNESVTLTATVLPADADDCNVNWYEDSNLFSVSEEEIDEGSNIRKATIKAYQIDGADKITVTTAIGNISKVCNVYVKEDVPKGRVAADYIEGLLSNENYLVNETSVISDEYGRIAIDDSWRDTTISLIKVNENVKCNSDAQSLAIGKKEIKADKVTLEYSSVDYDGTAKEPAVTVVYGGNTLTVTTDYTVTYSDNTNAGTAKVIVTGCGDYIGTVEKEFDINPLTMTGISASGYNGIYDGNSHTIDITGAPDDATITYATEIDGEYNSTKPERVDAGTTKIYYRIEKANYKTIEGNVTIRVIGYDLTEADVIVSPEVYIFDGSQKEPTVTVTYSGIPLIENTDYTVSYEDNVNAGQGKVIISGKGNYEGSRTFRFNINPASIEGKTIELDLTGFTYNGTERKPEVTIAGLTKDTDYTVSYTNNINAGTATVTVTGKGNYTGSISKNFTINAKVITPILELDKEEFTYNSVKQKPVIKVKDGDRVLTDADYTVTYPVGMTDIGKYKIDVTLKGNYSGTASAEYSIVAKSVVPTVVLDKTSFTYNGAEQKPTVTVKNGETVLTESDYTVTYPEGMINVGTYKVTVTLKGNYNGTACAEYNIVAKNVPPTILLDKTSFSYNGKVQKPAVTVKDGATVLKSTDYTVTYPAGMTNAGTYKVSVTLKGNYSGTASATYTITPAKLTPVVKLAKTSFVYNGKVQKPSVTVKNGSAVLKKTDYTVKYAKGCKNVGSYKVTVTLKGNYSGTASKSFVINPKATKVSKLTAGKKKLTVTWKKLTGQTTGYEVQYGTSKTFKGAKKVVIKKNKTTKTVIKKLKSKKTYYVRIRTYKTVKVNGKTTKLYSSWSKAKNIKVK